MTIIPTINRDTNKLKQWWRTALVAALLAIICAILPTAQAAPGDLDTSFAGFTFYGTTNISITKGMALLPDGKIVVLCATENAKEFLLQRYQSSGDLDRFNVNDLDVKFPNMFNPKAIAVQSDGGMVVAGDGPGFQLARVTNLGGLDRTFGLDGRVRDPEGGTLLAAALVQPDGKIVVAGTQYGVDDGYDFTVVRYTTAGARDNTFDGGDGKVTIGFRRFDTVFDLALQSDGKLVVVGRNEAGLGFQSDDFGIIRLNSNGTLDDNSDGDGGFDRDGKLSTGFGGDEWAKAVAVQPDGKLVVLGSNGSNSSLLARYMPNGNLDNSLDGDGKLTVPVDRLDDLVILPDNRIMLLGTHTSPDGDNKFALHRLQPNGTPDTTFDGDGIAWLDFHGNDQGTDLALQPDGRILAAGTTGNYLKLVRLWPDGSFDTGGKQTHGLAFPPDYPPGYRETANGLAFQSNDYFFVAGQVYDPKYTFSDAFVTRFGPNGQIVSSFGVNGSARVVSGLYSAARAVAVQPDDNIVIAGYSAFNPEYTIMDFLVARFNILGAKDPSFGSNGTYMIDFAGGADSATALALAPDGKIVVAGKVWDGSAYVWGVARLTNAGQPDNTFDNDGKTYIRYGLSGSATALAIQPDGKIIVAGVMGSDFVIVRLLDNGSIDSSFGQAGATFTDLGGTDVITALSIAPDGWLYVAGYRVQNGNADIALAQYTPTGKLASCTDIDNCQNWPNGTFFVDEGINDYAYALDLRSDNQLVAAGCTNQHLAGVQVRTDGPPNPLPFNTDFVGYPDCAKTVKFSGNNQILMVGDQSLHPFSSDSNIALARFETTNNLLPSPLPPGPPTLPPPPGPPTPSPPGTEYRVYLPIVAR